MISLEASKLPDEEVICHHDHCQCGKGPGTLLLPLVCDGLESSRGDELLERA